MAQSVIDLFESVRVKVGERDRVLATPGAFPLPIGILVESKSICNAGEAVYTRKLPLAIMQRLQRCDNKSDGDKEAEPDQRIPICYSGMADVQRRLYIGPQRHHSAHHRGEGAGLSVNKPGKVGHRDNEEY